MGLNIGFGVKKDFYINCKIFKSLFFCGGESCFFICILRYLVFRGKYGDVNYFKFVFLLSRVVLEIVSFFEVVSSKK